jgi:hypothetical protein
MFVHSGPRRPECLNNDFVVSRLVLDLIRFRWIHFDFFSVLLPARRSLNMEGTASRFREGA